MIALIEQWAESKGRKGLTPKYIASARRVIERCIRLMRWGHVRSITPAGLELLRETMLAKGASTGLVNSRMAAMGSFTTWLWRTGRIPADPMVDMKPLKHEPVRRRSLSPDEVRQLLGCPAIPEECRRVYAALVYSGLRVDIELATLTWQHVGVDGVLRFAGKGGKQRAVPIGDVLASVLSAQRASQSMHLFIGGVVFPAVPTPAEFDGHLALAGIPKIDSRGWVATRHSLRHTFNTMLYAAGVDSESRQHLGGWSTEPCRRTFC